VLAYLSVFMVIGPGSSQSPEESSDTPVCGPALTRPAVWDEAAYANADGLFLEGT
jgi:hypothetical protein